jgi:hypothetical protein
MYLESEVLEVHAYMYPYILFSPSSHSRTGCGDVSPGDLWLQHNSGGSGRANAVFGFGL